MPSGRDAAALAFASQLFHLWVLQEEFLFRPLSGGLLFLVAICQGLLAASLLFGAGKWMVYFGIALNAGVVLTWAATRFVGSPGLLGFDRLPVEPLNLAATVTEMALVVLLIRIGRRMSRERRRQERYGIERVADGS